MSLLLALTATGGYSITADAGSYSVTGVAAELSVGKVLTCESGGYTYSGVAATFSKTIVIEALAGEYLVSGKSAQIEYVGASTKNGGDDAFHHYKHTGWNKQAWQKKQLRDNAINATIEETYKQIIGVEPDPIIVAEIKQEAREEIKRIDYTQERKFIEWLTAEIANIRNLQQEYENDDEEAILLLL